MFLLVSKNGRLLMPSDPKLGMRSDSYLAGKKRASEGAMFAGGSATQMVTCYRKTGFLIKHLQDF